MKIRRQIDGQVFEGPAGDVPTGFERVPEPWSLGRVGRLTSEELAAVPGRVKQDLASKWETLKHPDPALAIGAGPAGPAGASLGRLALEALGRTGLFSGIDAGRAAIRGQSPVAAAARTGGVTAGFEALGGLFGPLSRLVQARRAASTLNASWTPKPVGPFMEIPGTGLPPTTAGLGTAGRMETVRPGPNVEIPGTNLPPSTSQLGTGGRLTLKPETVGGAEISGEGLPVPSSRVFPTSLKPETFGGAEIPATGLPTRSRPTSMAATSAASTEDPAVVAAVARTLGLKPSDPQVLAVVKGLQSGSTLQPRPPAPLRATPENPMPHAPQAIWGPEAEAIAEAAHRRTLRPDIEGAGTGGYIRQNEGAFAARVRDWLQGLPKDQRGYASAWLLHLLGVRGAPVIGGLIGSGIGGHMAGGPGYLAGAGLGAAAGYAPRAGAAILRNQPPSQAQAILDLLGARLTQ